MSSVPGSHALHNSKDVRSLVALTPEVPASPPTRATNLSVPAQTPEYDSILDPELLFQYVDKTKRAGKMENPRARGSFSQLPKGEKITAFHVLLNMVGLLDKPADVQLAFLEGLEKREYIRRVSSVLRTKSGAIDASIVLTAKFSKELSTKLKLKTSDLKPSPLPDVKAVKAPPLPANLTPEYLLSLRVHGKSGPGNINKKLPIGDSGAQFVDPKGNAVYTYLGYRGNESVLLPNSKGEGYNHLLLWNIKTKTFTVFPFKLE